MELETESVQHIDPKYNFVFYNFLLSVFSGLFIASFAYIIAPKIIKDFLNVRPGSFFDAFLLPISGITIAVSVYLFFKILARGNRTYGQTVVNQLKSSDRIDHEFPILSSSKMLAEKGEEFIAYVNGVFVGVMLVGGWILLIPPIVILYYLYHWQFTLKAVVSDILAIVVLILLSRLFLYPMIELYTRAKEIEYLSQILKKIDVNDMNDSEDHDEDQDSN